MAKIVYYLFSGVMFAGYLMLALWILAFLFQDAPVKCGVFSFGLGAFGGLMANVMDAYKD